MRQIGIDVQSPLVIDDRLIVVGGELVGIAQVSMRVGVQRIEVDGQPGGGERIPIIAGIGQRLRVIGLDEGVVGIQSDRFAASGHRFLHLVKPVLSQAQRCLQKRAGWIRLGSPRGPRFSFGRLPGEHQQPYDLELQTGIIGTPAQGLFVDIDGFAKIAAIADRLSLAHEAVDAPGGGRQGCRSRGSGQECETIAQPRLHKQIPAGDQRAQNKQQQPPRPGVAIAAPFRSTANNHRGDSSRPR